MKAESDPEEQPRESRAARLLLSHYRASRDNWRANALRRQARIRSLDQKLSDLQDSRANWKDKAIELRASNLSLLQRLEQLELQRDQLLSQLADALAKKVPPLAL